MEANFLSKSSDAEILELFSLRADDKSALPSKGKKRKHGGWEDESSPANKENVAASNVGAAGQADVEEDADRTCTVCLDARLEVLFTPCGHMCCCADCGTSLKQCPMCRE